jgi:dihydrodiol dehydrogenase / D-xylose 1-dehydrogenase (NADP)
MVVLAVVYGKECLTFFVSDGSYDEMLLDSNVDIVYIGNVHAFRKETVTKSLMANKHVLVEKPFACTVEDGEQFFALAKERDLFIMEGMWTRFFPAIQEARNLMTSVGSKEAEIGEIAKVYSDFNFYAADHEDYPTSFFYNRKLGGGASLIIAPYPIAVATMCFQNPPDSVKVVGQKDEATGVDIQGAMILSFPPTGSQHDGKCPKLPG